MLVLIILRVKLSVMFFDSHLSTFLDYFFLAYFLFVLYNFINELFKHFSHCQKSL